MSKIDRQREHQANERTFLAWLRTSIALIGFGLTISRFGLFLHELQTRLTNQSTLTHSFISSQTIGVSLVVVGIIVINLAVWRYNQVFLQIEKGDYQPNRLMVWITASIVIILGLLSLPLVLLRSPDVPNNSHPNQSSQNKLKLEQLLMRALEQRLLTKKQFVATKGRQVFRRS